MKQTNNNPIVDESIVSRIVWIDWAKVIGIYLVILGHMPIHGKSLIYCFHMPFFFIISGYLYKHVPISKEIGKSFRSLIVPYFIYSLLLFCLWACIHSVTGKIVVDIALGNQELLPRIFGPLWFVVSLIIMRIVCSLCNEKRLLIFMIITLCISVCLKTMNLLQDSYSNDYLQLQTTLVCLPFFLYGWVMRNKDILGYANELAGKYRPLIICVLMGGDFSGTMQRNG